MKVQFSEKPSKTAVLALISKDTDRIDRHSIVKSLDQTDRSYLANFQEKFPVKADHIHPLVLPSGRKIILFGAGDKLRFNRRKAILNARRIIATVRKERVEKIFLDPKDFITRESKDDLKAHIETLITQFFMANFEFIKYKTPPKEGYSFVTDIELFTDRAPSKNLKDAIETGIIIGEEINNSRMLANTPGGDMTPSLLAKEAEKLAQNIPGLRTTILDEAEIKKLKMGGIIGVSKGSEEKPKFIVMEYLKGKRKDKPVVLIGKGVTFDTGGLNLKPEKGISEMHMDMSGGAAVIHTIATIARLKLKKNIIALIPAVENMPSGSSYRPGDILTTMNGKTIEVLNTDAEGRIILADALEYSKQFNPKLVIDVATLTGAAQVALGQRASAILSNAPKVEQKLLMSGEEVGDYAWALPLWEEYEADIKGTFGDVANTNTGKTSGGGTITAAVFLWQFIKDYPSADSANSRQAGSGQVPWAHIDIAPRMTSIPGEHLAKGSAGAPIAMLVNFLRKF